MTIKALYPNVRPTLNLDFAKTKALDPRVTFTRASTATFVGSNGLIQTAASGAARFDHNPATGESLGLLVEEARTNSKTNSTTLNPSFNFSNTVSPAPTATIVAPDGVSQTVEKLVENTSTGIHQGNLQFSGAYDNWATSFFVKAAGRTRFKFDPRENGTFTEFDLTAETVNGAVDPSKLEKLPNGWFRVKNLTVSSFRAFSRWRLLDASGNESYTGDGVSGIYLWGLQWEAAATFSTSYIPTTGSTVTRAADVATLANTGSSIFPVSAFTTVNSPFGTANGGSTVKLVGPTVKRTAVYNGDLTQTQINALAEVNDDFWRWRVLGSSFALPSFTTDGSVTVDWGDGVVETLTTAVHTFTNGGGYHDIGFRLNSGTFFKPVINDNATYKTRVIATGPAPASMKVDASAGFYGCSALKSFDATVDVSGGTNFYGAWSSCSNLVSFPLVNTAAVTNFQSTWQFCSSLTSFPLVDTSAGTNFRSAWSTCSSLTSFPLINTAAGTTFQSTWTNCSSLTSFPLIDTAAGTNFSGAWYNCSSLTSFPLIDTAAGTNFSSAWIGCSSLTSFPLINTAAGTTFQSAWNNCNSLTSFPLINTAAGTNFQQAWGSCSSLTSFPLIDTSSGTNFQQAWYGCSSLTSFPLIDTAAGTSFSNAWQGCTSLTSFPLLNTAAGTNFYAAWYGCSSLTSFPLINTAAGTNFSYAWNSCSSLTSFPLIDTAAGTDFNVAWYNCSSLTSFPLIDTSSGTYFYRAWRFCSSLTDFPANFFDSWTGTPATNCFFEAWDGCSALTATSVENILNSIDTSGQSAPASGVDITIDYNASSGTPSVATAITNLQSRGWTITLNGVLQ